MHPEIILFFSRHLLEYDIYSLIKAFWTGAEVRITYDIPEDTAGKALCCVIYEGAGEEISGVRFSVELPDREISEALQMYGQGSREARIGIEQGSTKLEIKNRVKQLVYCLLRDMAGKDLPWGDLTGIRPVGLVSHLLASGMTDAEILRYMQTEWFVSDVKSRLALETAKRERTVLEKIDPASGWSLYIGIPFCPSICLYCSFGSHPLERWKEQVEDYLEALKKELRAIAQMMNEKRLDTIYIGGGTPTSLSENQLEKLMDMVTEIFDIRQLCEFTVEAGRPDTISQKKLRILKSHGVSRISVNPQTMNEKTLERIGRKHTVKETTDAFALAREEGFDNINMDLIIGLPGEGEHDVAYTLGEIKKLSPDSLTIHSLALKRATRLNLFREDYESDAFVNSEEIMEMTKTCAEEMGMHPYYLYRQKNIAGNFENTGYAREGKEGLYNILIMEQRQMIVAAGSGASTKLFADGGRIIRIENVKDLTQYLERVDEMIEKKRSGLTALRSGA